MPFLSIQDISISFGEVKALRNISIDLEKGDYLVVLGPSGAGKTSLLKCIAGLYKPDSGKIIINSLNMTKLPPEERSVAFMPQTYALFTKMDVWGNVSYGPKLQGKSQNVIEEICNDILEMVHLEKRKDAFPSELSGGMKQRTALARSLATGFPILLLDEPLRALDARLRIELRNELKRIVKKLGFTVLHVTHDQNEAMAVADRILILNRGKIVQIGSQQEIYYNPTSVFVSAFMDENNHFEGTIVKKDRLGEFSIPNGFDFENNNKIYYIYVIQTSKNLQITCYSKKHFDVNNLVDVVIKAESIRVKTFDENNQVENGEHKEKSKKISIFGILESKYFLGNWSKLKVKSDSFSWVIKLPSIRAERYELGKTLNVSYRPYNVILLSKEHDNRGK